MMLFPRNLSKCLLISILQFLMLNILQLRVFVFLFFKVSFPTPAQPWTLYLQCLMDKTDLHTELKQKRPMKQNKSGGVSSFQVTLVLCHTLQHPGGSTERPHAPRFSMCAGKEVHAYLVFMRNTQGGYIQNEL